MVNEIYEEMTNDAIKFYLDYGFKQEDIMITKSADIRYIGQEHARQNPRSFKQF